MVEPSYGARFLLKPLHTLRIAGKLRGQEFERGLSAGADIRSEIHFTHPAAADPFRDFVVADALTDQRLRVADQELGRDLKGRRFDEVTCCIVILEKQFNLAAQSLIAVTASLQESGSFVRRLFNRNVEDLGATLPALSVHPCLPHSARRTARRA